MKVLIAYENINFNIIKKLRESGFNVVSILEDYPGSVDVEVVEITRRMSGILLTEDSDFGELFFSHRIESLGVIYLRYHYSEWHAIAESVIDVCLSHEDQLSKSFIVITPNKIRIRKI